MRLDLFLLFFVFHYLFIFITIASSTNKYPSFNENNSLINIDFYQCDDNTTVFNSTTTTSNNDTIFNDLIDSCDVSCCTSNDLNETISSNLCQITVHSTTGICLGRLCYSGTCNNFALLANKTHDSKTKNKTAIMNQIRSSLSYTPWSSIVNSTQTKWSSLINKTGITIRDIILILLFIINISLTLVALVIVIKSIRHANIIADDRSYRYTLL